MDAMQQQYKLKEQIARIDRKRDEIAMRLKAEQDSHSVNTAARAEIVQSLTCLTPKERERADREIDDFDSRSRSSERLQESLKLELAPFVAQAVRLREELSQIDAAIRREEHAKNLEVFRLELQRRANDAERCLADTRTALAALNVFAANNVERFGFDAQKICGPVFEEFTLREANLDARGWRVAFPTYTNLRFFIQPMVRG